MIAGALADPASAGTAGTKSRRKRVLLINSIIARNDAISAFVRDMYLILAAEPDFQVEVIAYNNDFPDVPASLVQSSADLLLHDSFTSADLIIWHFGIFYELFNAMLIGNGRTRTRQVVSFHNVTPKEFLPPEAWATIDQSLQQCHHLPRADEVWPVSATNGKYAERLGVAAERVHVVPLAVQDTPNSSLASKDTDVLRILSVGRFVKSKGVLDLLKAAAAISQRGRNFRLTLVGNVEFSSAEYVAQIRRTIDENDLGEQVEWLGTVDDATLYQLYRSHHILAAPSYHEGFCKPVIEGLRGGCIPVAYAAHSLPETANGLGRMVPTGNIQALTAALDETLASLGPAITNADAPNLILDRGPTSARAFETLALQHAAKFSRERVRQAILDRLAHLLPGSGTRPMASRSEADETQVPG